MEKWHSAKLPRRIGCLALVLCMILGVMAFASSEEPSGEASGEASGEIQIDETKLFSDYNTFEEAQQAAAKLNLELCEEGNVLLKNDGTLPLSGNEYVSVFGVTQDNLIGGASNNGPMAGSGEAGGTSDGVADALMRAGFNVNPTLKAFYAENTSSLGSETTSFTGEARNSMEMYNDLAVVVFSRTGGEGSDLKTVMTQLVPADDDHISLKRCNASDYDSKYEGNPEYFDDEGYHFHKHYLMLTDSEEELIDYVTARFDKVVVIVNTSNSMELKELQDNPAICAILNIERPGAAGIDAMAEILAGKVNPSGRLVDEWAADFTTDPTWYNITYNEQNNSSNKYLLADGTTASSTGGAVSSGFGGDKSAYFGVDYEEGIYLGYKYYETYYQDIYNGVQPIPAGYEGLSKEEAAEQWWNDNVLYAFGYGLSYTSFAFKAEGLYIEETANAPLGEAVSASLFNSDLGAPAAVKTLYMPVTVTNTGSMAGKEVVQVYVSAPYTPGGIEKAGATMVGFAKTKLLAPGESETVIVAFNVEDFASFDFNDANGDGVIGDYELDAGTYIVRAAESAHIDLSADVADETDAYDEIVFELDENAHLKLDDFSDMLVGNKLSAENGIFDPDAEEHEMYYNSIRTGELMEDEQYAETILSRASFVDTFPEAPVYIVEKDEAGNIISAAGDLVVKESAAANWLYYDKFNLSNGYKDRETDAWYMDEAELASIMDGWTQEQDNGIKFTDMAGVPLSDTETWTAFMNQLTWQELKDLIELGGYSTAAVASIGKEKATDADGPNSFTGTYAWCDETTIASTWNTTLAEREGRIMGCFGMFKNVTGWYGPGMDVHRSPFSGRNNEYYSQDGIQGGYIAAAVVKGAESKGLICYIKHLAFNDQETCRDGKVQFVWGTEQALRENYIKMFQMAAQEGGSSAAMTGYARIGGIPNTSNHNLLTGILQDEWGWYGYLVTDGYIGWQDATELDQMVRSGNSLQLYTSPYVEFLSGEWDADANSVRIDTVDGESYISDLQYFYVRKSAQSILYMTANSTNAKNGFSGITLTGGSFTAEQFVEPASISVAIDPEILQDSAATYSLASGQMPQGMSINSATGTISGKPEQSGTFSFTVKATIDSYITATSDFVIEVAPAFFMDEDWDALDEAKVGSSFESRIESNIFTTDKYDSVVYSVASGELPDGITLSEDGKLSGTPTEAGVFDVTISCEGSTTVTTSSFTGEMQSTETTSGTYDIQFIVSE